MHAFHGCKISFLFLQNSSYLYCPQCNLGYEGWRWDPENKDLDTWHMSHLSKDSATENHVIHVKGIFVQDCFVTLDEEKYLMDQIDRLPWINSQSGRRKQVRI